MRRGGSPVGPLTVCVDVGATSLKAGLVDAKGELVGERVKLRTSWPMTPQKLVEEVARLVVRLPHADRLALGFPGRSSTGSSCRGGTSSAARGPGHRAHRRRCARRGAASSCSDGSPRLRAGRAGRNDADVAALACARGKGLELTAPSGPGSAQGSPSTGTSSRTSSSPSCAGAGREPSRRARRAREEARRRAKWHTRRVGALQLLHDVVGFDALQPGGRQQPARGRRRASAELARLHDGVRVARGILGALPLGPSFAARPSRRRARPRRGRARTPPRRDSLIDANVGLWCGPLVPSVRAAPTKK